MSEPFDSKYKLFKKIGVPFSGMIQSHLTIREDIMANKYKQESKKQEIIDEPRSVRSCSRPQLTRRQESPKKVQQARAKRTDQQQLTHLDQLLGKNKGAKKERVKLKERIKHDKSK